MSYRVRHRETFWNRDKDAEYPDEYECHDFDEPETLALTEFSAPAIYRAIQDKYKKRPVTIGQIQAWIDEVKAHGDENHCLPVLTFKDYVRGQSYRPHERVEVWISMQSLENFEKGVKGHADAYIESVRAEFV